MAGIKKFKPIIEGLRLEGVGESDTVTLVTDMLSEVVGYDKFKEVTSEYRIKAKKCDLATKIDGTLQALIEVKAVGHDLNEPNVGQAVDYAANSGLAWVVLTNGCHWKMYAVTCRGKIDQELVVDIDFLSLNHKKEADMGLLFLLCKEGWAKNAIDEYRVQTEPLNPHIIIRGDAPLERMLERMKTELRRVSPGAHLEIAAIKAVIEHAVIKGELLEDDKAEAARDRVAKAAKVALKDSPHKID